VKIYLTQNYDCEELFEAVIYAVMVEYKIPVTEFEAIIRKLREENYEKIKNHFVIESNRIIFDK